MLNQILQIIRQQVETIIAGKEDLSSLNIEEIINETFKAFQSGFGEAILKGKVSDLLSIFAAQSDLTKNAVVDDLIKRLTETLSTKDGLSFKNAFELASEIIPKTIQQVNDQIQQKTKGFDINSIINTVTGGKGSINFDDLLKTLENKVGQVDLNEVAQKFIAEQKENSGKFFDTLSKLIQKK